MDSLRDQVYPVLEEVMRASMTLPLSGTVSILLRANSNNIYGDTS